MTMQDWFPLGLTGLISLQFKGLLRVLFTMTYFYSAHLLPGHTHTQSQFSLTCQDLQFFLLMVTWCCKGKEHKGYDDMHGIHSFPPSFIHSWAPISHWGCITYWETKHSVSLKDFLVFIEKFRHCKNREDDINSHTYQQLQSLTWG